jgi:hypothetical protein
MGRACSRGLWRQSPSIHPSIGEAVGDCSRAASQGMSKQYDILLFGVSGFTGRLAAEHLLAKAYPGLSGVCAEEIQRRLDR